MLAACCRARGRAPAPPRRQRATRRTPAATTYRQDRRRTRGARTSARPATGSMCRTSGSARACGSSSGGNEYQNGDLITSGAGAMGLMQVMPETYDGAAQTATALATIRIDPHDNILAGTAYLREMYDIYGSPGFLAAYNAGPRRLDDYLSNNRPLPDETRRYVAMIGPNIVRRVSEHALAGRRLRDERAADRTSRAARATAGRHSTRAAGGGGRCRYVRPVEVAQLPEPVRATAQPPPQQYAMVLPPSAPPPARRLPLISAGEWPSRCRCVTPGRDRAAGRSRSAPIRTRRWLAPPWRTAREHAAGELAVAHSSVSGVHQPHGQLYRARLTGLSRDAAMQACQRLAHGRTSCMVMSPEFATLGWTPAGGCQSADRASVKRQPAR